MCLHTGLARAESGRKVPSGPIAPWEFLSHLLLQAPRLAGTIGLPYPFHSPSVAGFAVVSAARAGKSSRLQPGNR
jgi:hypothetical protein